jgi:hypothetical protein
MKNRVSRKQVNSVSDRTSSSVKTADQQSLIKFFAAVTILSWSAAFTSLSISILYFGRGTFDRLLSFKATDFPGNLQTTCNVNPLGVHYFGDLVSTLCHSMLASPYLSEVTTNYFPFTYVFFRPFLSMFTLEAGVTYVITSFILFGAVLIGIPVLYALHEQTISDKLIVLILGISLSQPMINAIDRGNSQIFVTGFLVCGIYLNSIGKKEAGPFLMGIAVALKGYPLIYLLRYIQLKQWRSLYLACRTALIATTISLLIFEGGLARNLRAMIQDISNFRSYENQLLYNNSIKAFFQSAERLGILPKTIFELLEPRLFFLSILILGLSFALLLLRNLNGFDATIICASTSCLILDLTAAYVLTLFVIPILFIPQICNTEIKNKILLTMIAVLMAPKNLILIHETQGDIDTSVGLNSIINPAIMITMITIIGFTHFKNRSRSGA